MGKFDNLIIETPSAAVENRILLQAHKPLQELRQRKQRIHFLKWLTVPAIASIVGALYFRNRSQMTPEAPVSPEEQMFAGIVVDEVENLDLIADLDLIENLDDLEAWEDS